MFLNAEIELKDLLAEIIPQLQTVAQTADDYENLLASANPFRGGYYTIARWPPSNGRRRWITG
jgi:hypothetical protein